MPKTQSKAPPARTFKDWEAAAANAEKLLKAGKISQAEYDRIVQQVESEQGQAAPFLKGIRRK